jgi:hypothetical protein
MLPGFVGLSEIVGRHQSFVSKLKLADESFEPLIELAS